MNDLLRDNKSLIQLDLGQWCMGNDGAAAIASALCNNNTLQQISLLGNDIDDSTSVIAVIEHSAVTSLDLSENHLFPSAQQKIVDAAKGRGLQVRLERNASNLGSSRTISDVGRFQSRGSRGSSRTKASSRPTAAKCS